MGDVIALDDPTATKRAITVLQEGGLVVLPTDTVYGVFADAFQADATGRVFEARRADRAHPLVVCIRSPRQLTGLVEERTEQADRLVAGFWPGPLTLVFTAARGLFWDLGDTRGTVSVRMPVQQVVLDVIEVVGPLAVSSAQVAGGPPPTTVDAAREALGDAVGLYVDGGKRAQPVTTIVDVSRGGAEVLRRGAISADDVVTVATGAFGWGMPPGSPPPGGGAQGSFEPEDGGDGPPTG